MRHRIAIIIHIILMVFVRRWVPCILFQSGSSGKDRIDASRDKNAEEMQALRHSIPWAMFISAMAFLTAVSQKWLGLQVVRAPHFLPAMRRALITSKS
jgi:branched-subunit amino acid transport protein AzlD